MKFVILTDIHLGPEMYYKNTLRIASKNIKHLLKNTISKIDDIKPDFIIILGDFISNVNTQIDKNNISYIVNLFSNLKYPVYYVTGNHDIENIPKNELVDIFNQKGLYFSFDIGNFHFVVLFSEMIKEDQIIISDKQIKWLKDDLNKTNKKTITFLHHSLADQDLSGNAWFEGILNEGLVSNRKTIRQIFSNSKKVVASFNGHLHWNNKNIHDNIAYFTIQSFAENENNRGIASEAFAIIDVDDKKINVDIKGNYPIKYLHNF